MFLSGVQECTKRFLMKKAKSQSSENRCSQLRKRYLLRVRAGRAVVIRHLR